MACVNHPIDKLEALDHVLGDLDFEPVDTEALGCEVCGRILDHEEMREGALCSDHQPAHDPHIEYVSRSIRRRYRGSR